MVLEAERQNLAFGELAERSILTGEALRQRQEMMAPSRELGERIIFMNCDDEESMKAQIESYIVRKFVEFGQPWEPAANVIETLRIVDQVYAKSQYAKRRTGESFGCHFYRAVAEFIHWADLLYRTGETKGFFGQEDRPFYLGGLATGLHDVGEDIFNYQFPIDADGKMQLPDVEIDFCQMGLSIKEAAILQQMGLALTKPRKVADDIPAKARAAEKFDTLSERSAKLVLYSGWYSLLPWIIKGVGDSRDNMRTEFERDQTTGEFRLRTSPQSGGLDKLINKLQERLYYYQEIDSVIRLLVQGGDGRFPHAICNNWVIAVALLSGETFDQIFGPCFAGQDRGRLAFFDPYSEFKFKYA